MRRDHDSSVTNANVANANPLARRQGSGGGELGRVLHVPSVLTSLDPLGSAFSPSSLFASTAAASPFQLMRRVQEDMDRLFAQAFGVGFSNEWGGSGGFAFPGGAQAVAGRSAGFLSPSMDVSETDREYRVEVDLPGVPEDAIDIQVTHDNVLVLRAEVRHEHGSSDGGGNTGQTAAAGSDEWQGQQQPQAQQGQQPQSQPQQQRQYHWRERRWGRFERVLSLPQDVDAQNVRADFQNGVLTVTLPKAERVAPQVRRIPIGGAAAGQQQIGQFDGGQGSSGPDNANNMATAANSAPDADQKSEQRSEAVGAGSGS